MKRFFKIAPILIVAIWFSWKWVEAQEIKKELPKLKQRGAIFIDVRTPEEFNSTKIDGTINIPLADFEARINEVAKDKPIVLCCRSGNRSGQAKAILEKNGFKETYNAGSCTNLE